MKKNIEIKILFYVSVGIVLIMAYLLAVHYENTYVTNIHKLQSDNK